MLSEEKIKEIRKNLKKYAADFDQKDRLAYSKLSKEIIAKRQKQSSEYKEVVERNKQILENNRQKLLELRGLSAEPEYEYVEEEYEFLVKQETVPYDQ